jgi:hypothetical protein
MGLDIELPVPASPVAALVGHPELHILIKEHCERQDAESRVTVTSLSSVAALAQLQGRFVSPDANLPLLSGRTA